MVKSLILCEGGEDIGFIKKLCEYLKLDLSKVDIKKMSGKSNFFDIDKYTIYKQQVEVGQYDKILFVVDSDNEESDAIYGGYKNTQTKIKEMIKSLGFDDNIASLYIMCDPNTKDGNLEHLLLSTLEDSKKKCLEELLVCIDGREPNKNKKILVSSYEVIFKDSPYDFDHKNFKILISKIKELYN